VSNAFYVQWLGEGMVYSCAYFEHGDETLDEAQLKKIDHILRKIRLQPGQRLLDIGCGWGALVLRAAQQYGAQCVGVTLSKNQYELARERVHAAGLQDRIQIRLQDYRDVSDGPFDRITSVGMFEHVGLDHLASYFGHIRRLLKPDGWVMNHGITSTDACDGETRHGGGHFIDRYVFPRGELPHIGTVLRTLQEGGLEAFDVENLRRHYQRTTQLWAEAFEAHTERIKPLVDERRWRIWRVYLAGCAWAFDNDEVSIYQVLCRPAGQPAQGLPWSRRWMYADR
jgi:cyclopropane-fatty-acyl-phospholipid synthase